MWADIPFKCVEFLSTLSLRRATALTILDAAKLNISIHALLAESDFRLVSAQAQPLQISIHALLAESDGVRQRCGYCSRDFYPRSPCGERPSSCAESSTITEFLSTLSLRRATAGERHPVIIRAISIHALLAESDRLQKREPDVIRDFYPRSPCGERRSWRHGTTRQNRFLSTLSLRRATASCRCGCCLRWHFYPRSPCGERLQGPGHRP